MRDVLGWRRKFGVIGPSTNTVVQPDFEMMRPVGVINLSLPKIKSVRIDGAAHQGQAALRCAQRAE
jgi:maleate cis-trans isomerase